MSKKKGESQAVQNDLPINVNGRFFSVFKVSHLLYLGCEIEVHNGIVADFKILGRAPDQTAQCVGTVQSRIWDVSKTQTYEFVNPEGAPI